MEPRFQEPAQSCFLLAFYVKLSQASTRVWQVIRTSGRSLVGTGRDAVGFQRQPGKRCSPVFTQNKHYENSWVNPTYASCELSFTLGLSSLLLVTSVRFPLFLWVRHYYMAWCWFVTRSHDVQVIPPWQSLVTGTLNPQSSPQLHLMHAHAGGATLSGRLPLILTERVLDIVFDVATACVLGCISFAWFPFLCHDLIETRTKQLKFFYEIYTNS